MTQSLTIKAISGSAQMIRQNSYVFLITMLWFSLVLASCAGQEAGKKRDRSGSLDFSERVTFVNELGEDISSVEVAIADDDTEQSLGLMFVYELLPDRGMLFLFPNEEPRSFWMANTPLPLDIIYVNHEMEIVSIHRNTPPFSTENFISGEPARYVVEVNGGYTITHNIHEGMRIRVGGKSEASSL